MLNSVCHDWMFSVALLIFPGFGLAPQHLFIAILWPLKTVNVDLPHNLVDSLCSDELSIKLSFLYLYHRMTTF